jgi:hypothetical protein
MHKYKCIFVHIPKNAGSSIMKLLGDDTGRFHVESSYYRDANYYFFRKYHSFAFTREPLERLFSAYKYAISGGNRGKEDILLADFIKANSHDFLSFIDNLLDAHFIMQQPLFKPQYLFVYTRNLELNVNTLIKLDELEQQWPIFAKKLGLPIELGHTNQSPTKNLPTLSNSQRYKVSELYRYDYSLLKYPPLC